MRIARANQLRTQTLCLHRNDLQQVSKLMGRRLVLQSSQRLQQLHTHPRLISQRAKLSLVHRLQHPLHHPRHDYQSIHHLRPDRHRIRKLIGDQTIDDKPTGQMQGIIVLINVLTTVPITVLITVLITEVMCALHADQNPSQNPNQNHLA